MSHLSTIAKRGFIPLIFLFLFSFLASAYPSYEVIGKNAFLSDESTLFNQYMGDLDVTISASPVSLPRASPLFADLNNDTIIEYVYMDDNIIYVEAGESSKTILAQYTLPSVIEANKRKSAYFYSNPAIYDTTGNGLKEIIIGVPWENAIRFLEYNNSAITLIANTSIAAPITRNITYMAIACNEPNCAGVVIESQSPVYNRLSKLILYAFNTTGQSSVVVYNASSADMYCGDMLRSIAVDDWDNDGKLDYGFTIFAGVASTSADYIRPYVFNVYTGLPSFSALEAISIGDVVSGSTESCDVFFAPGELFNSGHYRISSGIFADIIGDTKKEFAVSYCRSCTTTSGQIRTSYWDTNLDLKNTYPKNALEITTDINANIPGNLWNAGQIWDDSISKDSICGVAYSDFNTKMHIWCMSPANFWSSGYELEYQADFNLTAGIWERLGAAASGKQANTTTFADYAVHAIEAKSQEVSRPEIFTPYGIFEYSKDGLTQLIESTYGALWIPISDDANGLNDFLTYDTNAFYYVDDGLFNKNCIESDCLDRSTLEICPDIIDSIGKVNTTLRVRALWDDYDGDDITYNLTIYAGTDNKQSVVKTISSNTYSTDLTLKINQTTTDGIISLRYYDSGNPSVVNSWAETFTIQESGQTYSTSNCYNIPSVETETPGGINTGGSLNTTKENAITSITSEIQKYTNLTKDIVWLALMLIFAIVPLVLMYGNQETNKSAYITMIIFIEIIMMIIGVKMGFLGAGVIIAVVAAGAIITGLYIRSLITGGNSGG